jgi:hypothetical protein
VKNNLIHFVIFLVIFYIAYYIDSLQVENTNQQRIIKDQEELIEIQTIYINEIDDILNLKPRQNYLREKNTPTHRGPI